MIELIDINKEYSNSKEKVKALSSVSVKFESNGMNFIVGKSGSGKTTLLNILSTYDSPSSGSYIFCGKNISEYTNNEICSIRKKYFGFVFQEYNLIDELNVYDNIMLSLELLNTVPDSELVKKLLKKVGLEGYESRKLSELSGGQKQRVAIARALIKNPKVIFCDEPTGALDSETAESIYQLLKEISKTKLVIIVSHDREASEKYGDRILEIKDGRIINDTINESKHIECEKIDSCRCKVSKKVYYNLTKINLKKKPIRLATAGLMIIISLVLLGIVITSMQYNQNEIIYNSMKKDNLSYCALEKESNKENNKDFLWPDKFIDSDFSYFENNNINYICIYNFFDGPNNNLKSFGDSVFYSGSLKGFCEIDNDLLNLYGLKLVSGSLPQNDNQVVITKYQYQMYKDLGYKNNSLSKNINNYEDIIGETLTFYNKDKEENVNFIVSGILDTGLNEERYNVNSVKKEQISIEFYNIKEYGILNCIFLNKGYYDKYIKIDTSEFFETTTGSRAGMLYSDKYHEIERVEKIYNGSSYNNENIYYFNGYNKDSKGLVMPYKYFSYYRDLGFYYENFICELYSENENEIKNLNPEMSLSKYYEYVYDNDYSDPEFLKFTKQDYVNWIVKSSIDEVYQIYEYYDSSTNTIKHSLIDDSIFEFYNISWDTKWDVPVTGIICDLDNPNAAIAEGGLYEEMIKDHEMCYSDCENVIIPFNGTNKKMFCNFNEKVITIDDISVSYNLKNEYSMSYYEISDSLSAVKNVFLYSLIIVVPLIIILVFFYFSGVISDSRKNIGILKALGCTDNEVLNVFLLQNIFVSLALGLVACILTIIGNHVTVYAIYAGSSPLIQISTNSVLPYLIVLASSVLLIFIGTVIPILKEKNKTVISLLK